MNRARDFAGANGNGVLENGTVEDEGVGIRHFRHRGQRWAADRERIARRFAAGEAAVENFGVLHKRLWHGSRPE